MSTLSLNAIQSLAGKRILNTTGGILQVVQTVKTDATALVPGALWANVSGLSATITPTSASNKILVMCDIKGAGSQGASLIRTRLLRNNSPVYVGDTVSNHPSAMAQMYIVDAASAMYYTAQIGGTYLDSPATTSPVIYNIQVGADGTTQTVYINRTQGDRDTTYQDSRVVSSITLIEVVA